MGGSEGWGFGRGSGLGRIVSERWERGHVMQSDCSGSNGQVSERRERGQVMRQVMRQDWSGGSNGQRNIRGSPNSRGEVCLKSGGECQRKMTYSFE